MKCGSVLVGEEREGNMERLTGRRRERRQPDEETGVHSKQQKGEQCEKLKKVKNSLLLCVISPGESRGSAGVSVLQPHSQHHHCEHH